MSNMNYFEVDEFGELDEIRSIYPRNPYDDQDADNIFGLGNKKKKAERKLAKAEKKLAKGKTKQAERKIAKAEKLLGKVETGVATNQPKIQSLLDRSSAITSATTPQQTENLATDAGQIGAAAQPPIYSGGGGGGGDMETGYSPETNLATDTPESDEPTGDLAAVKDLPNVTVTGGGGNKALIYIVLAIVVIVGIIYFAKKKGKK